MATNNIIPYAFTPGTKAKAEEVNANFNALANEISDFKISVNTTIENTKDELEESIDGVSSNKLDCDFSNSISVTNCITSAPNGIVSYSGSTITIKEGLSVLIPNGKNSDGTLKNIPYTLENDISNTLIWDTTYAILLMKDGVYSNTPITPKDLNVTISETIPTSAVTQQTAIYKPSENKWYFADIGAVLVEVQMCMLGKFTGSNGTILSMKLNSPVELLKRNDICEITNWGMPDYTSRVSKIANTIYTAEYDGLLICKADVYAGVSGSEIQISEDGINFFAVLTWNSNAQSTMSATIPITKNWRYRIVGTFGSHTIVYVPLKGAN